MYCSKRLIRSVASKISHFTSGQAWSVAGKEYFATGKKGSRRLADYSALGCKRLISIFFISFPINLRSTRCEAEQLRNSMFRRPRFVFNISLRIHARLDIKY